MTGQVPLDALEAGHGIGAFQPGEYLRVGLAAEQRVLELATVSGPNA